MIGQTISHYKILEKLGEGGMGVVYKAEDTKLKRTVALKFLPPHLSASEQDKVRFIQEAQAASALNHPNVCTIHDIQEHDGQMFIVMEFVDGQTLGERKSSVSFKQAVDIGIQVADGLAAAHEKGIVHRDIKPDNIMVRKDGIVQIMDFGLAKLKGVSRLTREGSTVGTAGYMSPEQVQGHDADHRSDIFSLGVLLYELFTGQLPFKGVHETAMAYEIVNVDAPPMSAVKPEIDPGLDAIVLECLEKDPNERTQSVKQVAIDLKRFKRESSRQRMSRITAARPVLQSTTDEGTTIARQQRSRSVLVPWSIAALLGVCLLAVVILYVRQPEQQVQTFRSFIHVPERSSFAQQSGGNSGGGHVAISPDGHKVAFVAVDSSGRPRLWVRSLNALSALPLPGTEDAFYPFWSPNSQFIGFFTSGKLKKIDASGGPALSICDVQYARGGSWNQEDVIVFTPSSSDPLYQVSAAGGAPAPLTKLDTVRHESTHRFPWFLPDGKHLLYFARIGSGGDGDACYVASLDGTVNKQLFNLHSNIAYANGYLLFIREQALMAQPFDLEKLELNGNAVPIAEQVQFGPNWNKGSFSVSQNGVLIYEGGSGQAINQLAFFDRSGRIISVLKGTQSAFEARISPDGKKIAFSSMDSQRNNEDLWIYDISRSISTRFTFDPKSDSDPAWSPDGQRLVFASDRKGKTNLYQKHADGTGSEEPILETTDDMYPTDWSSDGKFIAYTTFGIQKTKRDLWTLSMTEDRKPASFLQTEFTESEARFSPEGRWLAYGSDESGQREIYVRAFPGPGGKWQVSTGGSSFIVCWRNDGREMYYLSADGKLMAAEVNGAGSTFTVGVVKPLFEAQAQGATGLLDATRDGQRFLLSYTPVGTTSANLTLVTNWDREMKTK